MFNNKVKMKNDGNNVISYDTWGNSNRADKFRMLKELLSKKINAFNVGDKLYVFNMTRGGGIGMGESPDSIIVSLANIH